MSRVFTDAGAMSIEGVSELRLTNMGAFSVAFWVYRTAVPAAERAMIVTYNGTAGSGWIINMLATGGLQAYMPFTTQDKVRKSTTVPALNTWVHCVVTQENRGLADTDWLFFFNGVQEAGTAVAAGIGTHSSTATGVLRIGNNSATILSAPPMNLGLVSIWDRAITPAECLALAGGAHPLRFRTGLVDYFEMQTAHGELGQISNTYLAQGATNPTSAFANPPMEPMPSSLYPARQNYRTRRARYFAAAAGGGPVLNDYNLKRVARGVGMGVFRGAA